MVLSQAQNAFYDLFNSSIMLSDKRLYRRAEHSWHSLSVEHTVVFVLKRTRSVTREQYPAAIQCCQRHTTSVTLHMSSIFLYSTECFTFDLIPNKNHICLKPISEQTFNENAALSSFLYRTTTTDSLYSFFKNIGHIPTLGFIIAIKTFTTQYVVNNKLL